MLTKEEIKYKIKQNARTLKNFNVNRIGIFGSYIKGTSSENSDIDLLLDFSNTISLPQYVHFSDIITGFLNQNVDIVTVNGIKPFIRDNILNEVEWIEWI